MERVFVTGGSGFVGRRLIPALLARGREVRALARSDAAAAEVTRLGAQPVRGDLDDVAALRSGMRGTDTVFHAAAHVVEHGPLAEFMRVTVGGTERIVAAAQAEGVARLLHVSTEAVLADGRPIVRADETRPYPARPAGPYAISKGAAERVVLAANGNGLTAVVVRPRFVWGPGDTSLGAKFAAAAKSGRFAWVDGGRYLTSTCHVDNLVEGLLLAAERGHGGEAYFLTDGAPIEFRTFVTRYLAAVGVDVTRARSVPRWLARATAFATSWMAQPPITASALAVIGVEVTVDDRKARRDLGYRGAVDRETALASLSAARATGRAGRA